MTDIDIDEFYEYCHSCKYRKKRDAISIWCLNNKKFYYDIEDMQNECLFIYKEYRENYND